MVDKVKGIDMEKMNEKVTNFLNELNHPSRAEIDTLRVIISNSVEGLTENVKWNGPNYCFSGHDRITMRIHPPKNIQLIFHRGAKRQKQPKDKLIKNNSKLLTWKEKDRAVAVFSNISDVKTAKIELTKIIKNWINATK